MSKLPDWMPDDEEIAGVIRGECWDVRSGDSRRAARAIRELLELKAGEADDRTYRGDGECLKCAAQSGETHSNDCQPDGKPDPAPVASTYVHPTCPVTGRGCLTPGACDKRPQCIPPARPRKDG